MNETARLEKLLRLLEQRFATPVLTTSSTVVLSITEIVSNMVGFLVVFFKSQVTSDLRSAVKQQLLCIWIFFRWLYCRFLLWDREVIAASIQTVTCQRLHCVWCGGDLYQMVPYFKD